jgi:hypothetical protein
MELTRVIANELFHELNDEEYQYILPYFDNETTHINFQYASINIPDFLHRIKKLLVTGFKPINNLSKFIFLQDLFLSCDFLPRGLENLTSFTCNEEITHLPLMLNLKHLNIDKSGVTTLPKELIALEFLSCCNTNIKEICPTYTKLKQLNISNSAVETIPDVFVELETLDCCDTMINILFICILHIR